MILFTKSNYKKRLTNVETNLVTLLRHIFATSLNLSALGYSLSTFPSVILDPHHSLFTYMFEYMVALEICKINLNN